ncbi:MAG TPA: hypothetical protein EYP86_01715 [Candidatus Altiarchaeales archaeon]|nr:hypothetical protein [Candidatus Altiarchaeales archaeon]
MTLDKNGTPADHNTTIDIVISRSINKYYGGDMVLSLKSLSYSFKYISLYLKQLSDSLREDSVILEKINKISEDSESVSNILNKTVFYLI